MSRRFGWTVRGDDGPFALAGVISELARNDSVVEAASRTGFAARAEAMSPAAWAHEINDIHADLRRIYEGVHVAMKALA
jgi:hypothetical protein